MNKLALNKLKDVLDKYNSLEAKMSDPEIASDHKKLVEVSKEHSAIEPIAEKYKEYSEKESYFQSIKSDKYEDQELQSMLEEERKELEDSLALLEKELEVMLLPKDPNDDKNVVVEIRSGAGGDEASIFVNDLFTMYERYLTNIGWKIDILNSNPGTEGLKEIIFSVKGKGAYSKLKFESGVHRVQRVPKTESAGRIHTSTVTVAVLPEAEDIEININPSDLEIDVYRASGAGGQHVNTTDSAVRITHKPTGIVVTCQDGRSQIKNREKAMQHLKAKIFNIEQKKAQSEREDARRSQIGSGDRSEKIRTYNYPQGRVTDHRIGLTIHRLPEFMNGDIEEMVTSLIAADHAEKLSREV